MSPGVTSVHFEASDGMRRLYCSPRPGHYVLEPALAALGQQMLANIVCLRTQKACNTRPADQMAKSTLAGP
jgi:hypothetical protein